MDVPAREGMARGSWPTCPVRDEVAQRRLRPAREGMATVTECGRNHDPWMALSEGSRCTPNSTSGEETRMEGHRRPLSWELAGDRGALRRDEKREKEGNMECCNTERRK